MNNLLWSFGKLGFAINNRVEVCGYNRVFWRFHWKRTYQRVVSYGHSTTLSCQWCGQVASSAVHHVWTDAEPVGYLVRLCDDCQSSCSN